MPEAAAPPPSGDQGAEGSLTGDFHPQGKVIQFPGALTLPGPSQEQSAPLDIPQRANAMPDITREEMDARFRTAAAETNAKFAEMIGEVRLISSDLKGELGNINTRLDHVERSTSGVKGTIIITAVGVIAIVVAVVIGVLAFGAQWFGLGLTTHDTIRATIKEMQEPPMIPPPPKPR